MSSKYLSIEQLPGVSELPPWVQYIQALGAPSVAVATLLVTGYVAWRQWRTAHEQWRIAQQRVVLDLFDRRMRFSTPSEL